MATPTPTLPARGRGSATLNPQNRFEKLSVHVEGEHLDEQLREGTTARAEPAQRARFSKPKACR